MVALSHQKGVSGTSLIRRVLVPVLALGLLLPVEADEYRSAPKRSLETDFKGYKKLVTPTRRDVPEDWNGKIPLLVTNRCDSTIWPGIASQAGTGPGTGGFELESGDSKQLWVSPTWQGRVWGRTNCTVNKDSCSCKTGDCFGKLDCEFSVSVLLPTHLPTFGV